MATPPAPALPTKTDPVSGDQGRVLSAGFRGYFIETLSVRLDALEAARLDLEAGSASAVASIHRIARSLRAAGRMGFPNIAARAEAIQQTDSGSLKQQLQDLIREIGEAIAGAPTAPVRILVIEPDEDTADLLEVILSAPNRAITICRTPGEALASVQENAFGLIILSLNVTDMDGRDLLMTLRDRRRTTVVPIFVLSENSNPQLKTECLALGADYFFTKPFDPSSLSSTVAAQLQRQASSRSRDPLTGLPDRLAMQDAFDLVISLHRSFSSSISLAVVGIDHFARIKDIYGPLSGEEVVRRTADLILQSLRRRDLLARWTEDVFVVLFPETTEEEAAQVLDRSIQTVGHEKIALPDRDSLRISCSAGVLQLHPGTLTLKAAVTDATYFLYLAKAKSGGRVATVADSVSTSRAGIVIVEDDQLTATIVKDRLVREGYDVRHFTNGYDAIQQLPNMEAALFILDVNLPGASGFELLVRLREEPSLSKTPVLMLTAMSSERDIVRGFELGADDYILKPFSTIELVARVQRFLRKRK